MLQEINCLLREIDSKLLESDELLSVRKVSKSGRSKSRRKDLSVEVMNFQMANARKNLPLNLEVPVKPPANIKLH